MVVVVVVDNCCSDFGVGIGVGVVGIVGAVVGVGCCCGTEEQTAHIEHGVWVLDIGCGVL